MRPWLVVLLLALAAVLAYVTKPRTGRRRPPKPGEGMRRRDRPARREYRPGGPGELVRVATLPAEEAHVAAGFLAANGIDAPVQPRRSALSEKGAIRAFDVYVAPDRADEARALLDAVRSGRRR